MEKHDALFIGIRDPQELRRDLLESTRSLLVTLRRFEDQKKLHGQKMEKVTELKGLMREIERLVTKLRVQLPKAKVAMILEEKKRIDGMIPHVDKKHPKKAKLVRQVVEGEEPLPVEQKSEITRLEAELADIEEKLGKLS